MPERSTQTLKISMDHHAEPNDSASFCAGFDDSDLPPAHVIAATAKPWDAVRESLPVYHEELAPLTPSKAMLLSPATVELLAVMIHD